MRTLLALLAVPLLLSCNNTEDPTEPEDGAQVQATNDQRFNPLVVTIAQGEKVTWVFQSTAHTVTFDNVAGAPPDIGTAAAPLRNTSEFAIFPNAGTFAYHCEIHPVQMTGQVIVE